MYFCLIYQLAFKKTVSVFHLPCISPQSQQSFKILWSHKVYYDFTTNINLQGSVFYYKFGKVFFFPAKKVPRNYMKRIIFK